MTEMGRAYAEAVAIYLAIAVNRKKGLGRGGYPAFIVVAWVAGENIPGHPM